MTERSLASGVAAVFHFIEGAALGASLIIAIGAQNAFVLGQALRDSHAFLVAGICSLVDASLIGAGIWGLGRFIDSRPALLGAITLGGALFLFVYAGLAFRRALYPRALEAESVSAKVDRSAVIANTFAISLLNPHVYLDTVLLLGSLGGRLPGNGPFWFGLGAVTASFVWFFGLASSGRRLAPVLATPRHWQWLDLGIATVMLLIGAGLLRRYLSL